VARTFEREPAGALPVVPGERRPPLDCAGHPVLSTPPVYLVTAQILTHHAPPTTDAFDRILNPPNQRTWHHGRSASTQAVDRGRASIRLWRNTLDEARPRRFARDPPPRLRGGDGRGCTVRRRRPFFSPLAPRTPLVSPKKTRPRCLLEDKPTPYSKGPVPPLCLQPSIWSPLLPVRGWPRRWRLLNRAPRRLQPRSPAIHRRILPRLQEVRVKNRALSP